MKGENIVNALNDQVVHYNIQSSLFDIILAALIRFLLLIVFYGIFGINHWFIIAVSFLIYILNFNKTIVSTHKIMLTVSTSSVHISCFI